MRSVVWLEIESTTQKVCGVISITLNLFLIYLILAKSPPKLGGYKWLMLYTYLFEWVYACLNIFVGPSMHNYNSVCMVFQDMNKVWFGHGVAEFLVVVYCSFFGSSIAIFAVHFIYRYGAVNLDFRQKYLSGAKQVFLYISPIACGVFWGLTVWYFMSESQVTTDYLRDHMMQKFGLKIEECAYIALYFWPVDKSGNVYPEQMSFIGVVIMYIVLGATFFCVIYFGINCYRWISRKLGNMENVSQAAKSLQVQLFYALLIQAAIPCLLMYLPAAMIFTCPMLNIDLDLKYPFIGVTIAIYPVIDPFPTILIIKSYRRGCIDLLTCRRKKNQIAVGYGIDSFAGGGRGASGSNTHNHILTSF
ncbi:hypothetical protein GCK72_016926 [Caenorhabditis remanei]|uniref:Serpentine receptor class r-10 n=1 Tax=Caenorhabditis remanei TaxID=31234 RepID=A0A6A5G5Z1_CAERE|nr:hypothetical protein GCK72_016926 [Caenorhabditis remanei]KAF1750377.1 hypothetical protein GCK72_016926 [Caenorhabditis remanei]